MRVMPGNLAEASICPTFEPFSQFFDENGAFFLIRGTQFPTKEAQVVRVATKRLTALTPALKTAQFPENGAIFGRSCLLQGGIDHFPGKLSLTSLLFIHPVKNRTQIQPQSQPTKLLRGQFHAVMSILKQR